MIDKICVAQVRLGTEVLCTSSLTDWGSNSRPPDDDSTLHVTETPSLATRPSVTLQVFIIILFFQCNRYPIKTKTSFYTFIISKYSLKPYNITIPI